MAEDEAPDSPAARVVGQLIRWSEDVLYGLVSVLLVAAAAAVLVHTGWSMATEAGDGVRKAVEHALDSLLIVFIIVELLGAVRATIVERHLVAEPFLLVGIIASIKEIVVTGVFAEERGDVGETMLQVGVLGAVVLGLSVASLLLRRKEREPSE